MIHPDTELRAVNPQIGLGVFATRFIPMGTITYADDALEIRIPGDSPLHDDPRYRPIIEKYAHLDENNVWTISWDIARYVNHCCHCNTITTAYGFEIAIRDIQPGEQITDEYALFEPNCEMELLCDHPDCRKRIRPDDIERYGDLWDAQIRAALAHFRHVPQPLLPYLEEPILSELNHYLETGEGYRSVRTLACLQRAAAD